MLSNKEFIGDEYNIHFIDENTVQFKKKYFPKNLNFKTLVAMAILADDNKFNYTIITENDQTNVLFHDKIESTFAVASKAKLYFELSG